MNHLANVKVGDIHTDSISSGSLATTAVDTQGFDSALIIISAGALGGDLSAISVAHSDASDMSGSTNAVVFQSTADSSGTTNALADFDADESILISLDLEGKGRYVKTTLTVSAATDISCTTLLGRASESPVDTAAGHGVDFHFNA